jgi:hypothetical protein
MEKNNSTEQDKRSEEKREDADRNPTGDRRHPLHRSASAGLSSMFPWSQLISKSLHWHWNQMQTGELPFSDNRFIRRRLLPQDIRLLFEIATDVRRT